MKNFKAVVFDMDGVIIDSERLLMRCWDILGEKYGLEDAGIVHCKTLGLDDRNTEIGFKKIYGQDFPYHAYAKEVGQLFVAAYERGELQLKAGVKEILNALHQAGKTAALATSTDLQYAKKELTELGVFTLFDQVITGDMVTKGKPDPEIFLTACQKLGVEPGECYAIEDSYNGIQSAWAGGLRVIMVPDLAPAIDEIRPKTETICHSLLEVCKYLGLD